MPEPADNPLSPALASPRHLAVVILEIFEASDEIAKLDARWRTLPAASAEQDACGDESAVLDTKKIELEREARAMVESATGVPWEYIQRALP